MDKVLSSLAGRNTVHIPTRANRGANANANAIPNTNANVVLPPISKAAIAATATTTLSNLTNSTTITTAAHEPESSSSISLSETSLEALSLNQVPTPASVSVPVPATSPSAMASTKEEDTASETSSTSKLTTSTYLTNTSSMLKEDTIGIPYKYRIRPKFKANWNVLLSEHFSKDPNKWPIYAESTLGYLAMVRGNDSRYEVERLANDKDFEMVNEKMESGYRIPEKMSLAPGSLAESVAEMYQNGSSKVDPFLVGVARMSKNFENPAFVENVVGPAADPAFYGTVVGAMVNANLVHIESSLMASQLEKYMIRMIADIVGYDPEQSTGIFTFGGTGCNIYGYLLGLRKSIPQTATHGLDTGQDYRFINSQACHYSNVTNLSLLGANIESKLIRTRMTENNDMDLDDLEKQLRACFQLSIMVPTIMLTCGSTDTFAIDLIGPVAALRDRLCEEYQVKVKPNIHVDAAVGWALIFFFDYDFDKNPLDINAATLHHLKNSVKRCKDLKLADSFTVDFHKWGYVPYASSLVMIKNRDDLKYLENDGDLYTYFDQETEGHTHLHSTIECSRSASGVFGAAFALHYLGKQGYQLLVAHTLQNAEYFRFRLSCESNVIVIPKNAHGPTVNFRLYDPVTIPDAEEEHETEKLAATHEPFRARLFNTSEYHYKAFKSRPRLGLYTSWIRTMTHSDYDEHGRCVKIPGEKACFFNPRTTYDHIDEFLDVLHHYTLEASEVTSEESVDGN